MIPKIIHYCWFGHNPKPELAKKCIESWKKHCPDYEIIEWNEDSVDISACPLYVRQAYEMKKWPFVTDYVRLKVVYEHGGIYMDTDVELKKQLDPLLRHQSYFGFEDGKYINTGLGFGAIKGAKILEELMRDYLEIPFVLGNGTLDQTPCPMRNTEVFVKYGLKQDNSLQTIPDDILILPKEYLCPIDYLSGKRVITKNTVSIHWFAESWKTEQEKQLIIELRKKRKMIWKIGNCISNAYKKIGRALLGEACYTAIKRFLKDR